jgi:hydrogenase-4 component B
MDFFLFANLIIVLGGFAALISWQRFHLMKALSVTAMATGCLMGAFDAFSRLFTPEKVSAATDFLATFSLAFRIDELSAFFLVVIYGTCFLATLYSYHYLGNAEKALGTATTTFFFSLLTVSMALVVTADNTLTFILVWEVMSLSSFFLVIHDYRSAENRRAGFLYFVFSHVGAMFLFAGFGVLFGQTGDFSFAGAAGLSEAMKIVVFVLCFIGFGSKAGVFPFHVWLPHAHPAAPSHISAVMSGVMIKTGIYGIIRLYSVLGLQSMTLGVIVLVAGMVSGILGVVYALGQNDLKRMLAYSSVENIGVILIGFGVGMIGMAAGQPLMAVLGFAGGFLHILNHSLFKSLLFMGAGFAIQKTGIRSISSLGGLMKKLPVTGITFLVGSLAISGLPPFNGFAGEFFIYLGSFQGVAMSQSVFAMCVLSVLSLAVIGGLALACFTRVVGVAFQGEPRVTHTAVDERGGATMLVAMVFLAAACGAIGIFPGYFIALVLKGVGALHLGFSEMPLEPFMETTSNITLAAILFLAVFGLIVLFRLLAYRGKPVGSSGTWGCGFTRPTTKMQYTGISYSASILEFFGPVAPLEERHESLEGRFPQASSYQTSVKDVAELHMEPFVVRPVLWLFDRLRWIQHGDIHLYIGYILLAIVVLLFFV